MLHRRIEEDRKVVHPPRRGLRIGRHVRDTRLANAVVERLVEGNGGPGGPTVRRASHSPVVRCVRECVCECVCVCA